LGLESELLRANRSARRRYVFLGDRLRALPRGPLGLLASGILSARGKAKLLSEPWAKPRAIADESVHEFGCRRLGKEATETLLDAAATGIHAGDIRKLSLRACFPRIAKMEVDSGSLTRAILWPSRRDEQPRRLRLTTLQGGMESLVVRLAERLQEGVELDRPVLSLKRNELGWKVVTHGGEDSFDVVALTCPAYEQARLLASLDEELSREIGNIEHNSAVVCTLGYSLDDLPRVPTGFGYLAPAGLGRPVLGVIFSSAVFPQQAPTGHFQFRAILGGSRRPDVIDWTDAAIVDALRKDLLATLGIEAPPAFEWIYRWPKAIPQYHVGHLDRLERIEKLRMKYPGLILGGSGYRGAGVNDCIVDAELLSEGIRAIMV
jgi:oxygen-dependent protoporphyrinogen oxidase